MGGVYEQKEQEAEKRRRGKYTPYHYHCYFYDNNNDGTIEREETIKRECPHLYQITILSDQ